MTAEIDPQELMKAGSMVMQVFTSGLQQMAQALQARVHKCPGCKSHAKPESKAKPKGADFAP